MLRKLRLGKKFLLGTNTLAYYLLALEVTPKESSKTGFFITHKHYTRAETFVRNKHASLFQTDWSKYVYKTKKRAPLVQVFQSITNIKKG
jgi:hypothetical protein